jgi:hypothetical protein
MNLFSLEWWEGASYIVTVIGLPFIIWVFMYEQKRDNDNDEAEIYQYLSEEYAEFQKLVLENADLRLNSAVPMTLNDEQRERQRILFDILISLFERAYLLVYEDKMSKKTARLWASWEDYIRFWVQRPDFRAQLPELLEGEDPDFVAYVKKLG